MRTGQGGDDLTQGYQNSRVLEGYDGLIFSDMGLGTRIFPEHIKQARLTLRPGDAFYDEDNAHVLTPIRYDVEGLHVDVPPTELSKGLREWGWDTVPTKTKMRDSKRIITVGSAMHPPGRSAFVVGWPLAINPTVRIDAVAEVANRINPLNPINPGEAPYMDLMNMGMETGGMSVSPRFMGVSPISPGSPDWADASTASASTAVSAPSFGSVATDLAVGGLAHRANTTIKENAEAMKAKYNDLRTWCDSKFQQVEQAMQEQTSRTTEMTAQISGVVSAQADADQRARTAETKQEQNQSQLMGMLQGLTRLATGGPGQPPWLSIPFS